MYVIVQLVTVVHSELVVSPFQVAYLHIYGILGAFSFAFEEIVGACLVMLSFPLPSANTIHL